MQKEEEEKEGREGVEVKGWRQVKEEVDKK